MMTDVSCLINDVRLLIFPCAGGRALNYDSYKEYLPEATIYEYKGHWTRFAEPLSTSMNELIEDIIQPIILERPTGGVFLYGHSMGALVAWKVAKELSCQGINVKGLYVAACSPPSDTIQFFNDINSDEDIKEFLAKVRQVPRKILKSDFFARNLLPVIKNDFMIIKKWIGKEIQHNDLLECPTTCFCGTEDTLIDKNGLLGWNNYTKEKCYYYELPGDHFFVYGNNNVSIISSIIREDMYE